MSAWIVSKLHVDVLVYGLGTAEIVTGLSPTEIGQELWEENHRSINFRYAHHGVVDTPAYTYEVPTAERIQQAAEGGHQAAQVATLTRIDNDLILGLVECYDYQSCEHPGWGQSRAKKWCDTLYSLLIATGADSTNAPWGV